MNNPSEEKRVPGGQGKPSGAFGDGSTPFPQPDAGEQADAVAVSGEAAATETEHELVTEDAAAQVQQLQQALEEAEARAEENWDRSVRLQAEMDNQRRRLEKQVEDAHKYSVQKFVESLLPVVDSLEMGLQAEGSIEKIREGMDLTLKQFATVMEKFNIE
ncbi:MAG: nucleotide exchange factor GrpE, partial [Thiothrix sp.]|nr:nucleotide exchange factor GrpE [Thiothrix sp.]